MKIFDGLRRWWQYRTGEEDTPFDGGTPGWVVSMLFHLCLMFGLAFTLVGEKETPDVLSFNDLI